MAEATNSLWDIQLQEGQIRLFNIQLDDGDQIKGFLEIFDHESAPEYIAQSYVCGESRCDTEINVNGNSHYIKANLSIALQQTKKLLRQRSAGKRLSAWTSITRLWIDAVCINQSNPKELEVQIRFMENIYRRASSTFVSIGTRGKPYGLISRVSEILAIDARVSRLQSTQDSSPSNSDQAHVINTIRSRRLKQERAVQADFEIGGEDLEIILAKLKPLQPGQSSTVEPTSQALNYLHPFWQACIKFFEAEWFSRLWTYQELVLSRRLFVTLQYCVPWSRLRKIYNCLRSGLNNERNIGDPDSRSTKRDRVNRFLLRYSLQDSPFRRLPADCNNIWKLLVITAQRRARVPKDHVFAILGLMDADTRNRIPIDYSRTNAQVFVSIVKLALEMPDAALRLPKLWEDFAWVPSMTRGLPSWCPDLNNKTNARIGWFSGQALPKSVLDAFTPIAQLQIAQNESLTLRVLELDTVLQASSDACPAWAVASPVLSTDSHVFSRDAEILVWIRCLSDKFSQDSNNHQAVTARLQGFFDGIVELPKKKLVALVCLLTAAQLLVEGITLGEVVVHARQALGPQQHPRQEILEELDADPEHKALARSLIWISDLLRGFFGGTCVFTTANGRMGHSPRPVSPGDRICVVPGGAFLHVFSKVSKRYVTCATVHGLMGDGLLEIAGESERDWQEIDVR
jgi:hypothetical protein